MYRNVKFLRASIAHTFAIITLWLTSVPAPVLAQQGQLETNASLAEKIYLQLDRKVYMKGDEVWFKSIVLNSQNHFPSILSGILYVELITPEEKIHEKKLIKLENGIGQGSFFLEKYLPPGPYLLRAYTQWNENFGPDFFFEEYIQVFSPLEKNQVQPITEINLIKNQATNADRLVASLNPYVLDSLHKGTLTVFAQMDDKKDTLVVNMGKDNHYLLDMSTEKNIRLATLHMKTANGKKHKTTIVLNKEYLDLQFFPESGVLVYGLPGKIGFQAVDASGKGKVVEGDIIDERDSVLVSFKSNALGMGSFELMKINTKKTYFARLKKPTEANHRLLYPLPAVAVSGNTLSLEKQGNNILLTALSNNIKNDSIYLKFSARGVNLYLIPDQLEEGIRKRLLPANELPEGIIAITMMDKNLRPLAERLYFNEKLESRINLAVTPDKDKFGKREKTDLKIVATNTSGQPVNANLSLLVINKQQLGEMQHMRQNVFTYFLLDSELKGHIENPGYYFSAGSRNSDLDALMLTQGWRKYVYSDQYNDITQLPEGNLSISGHVTAKFSDKKQKEAELTMMTFGKSQSIHKEQTDSLGIFKFNIADEYGKEMGVVIRTSKSTGKKKDYNVWLDEKKSPPFFFNTSLAAGYSDSVMFTFVEKEKDRAEIEEGLYLGSKDLLLNEVEVSNYELTPNRKMVADLYGEPTKVIDGEEIQAKETSGPNGLYSVLMFHFPEIQVKTDNEGKLYPKVTGSDLSDTPLLVIDGIPVKRYDYHLIGQIQPADVKSVEIIRFGKSTNYGKLYMDVFDASQPPAFTGSIIAIYTYAGLGVYGKKKLIGIEKTAVPVFTAPKEFYAPKYENIKPEEWTNSDLRALVHWEPMLKVDSLGKASVAFYNADITGEMAVIVEAVSESGEFGYQEIIYEVEESPRKD